MNEIIENTTIIYTDGIQEQFEAICVTDKGIQIGRIIKSNFVPFGYIPNHSIKEINMGKEKKVH
jgi:hypothetical protein